MCCSVVDKSWLTCLCIKSVPDILRLHCTSRTTPWMSGYSSAHTQAVFVSRSVVKSAAVESHPSIWWFVSLQLLVGVKGRAAPIKSLFQCGLQSLENSLWNIPVAMRWDVPVVDKSVPRSMETWLFTVIFLLFICICTAFLQTENQHKSSVLFRWVSVFNYHHS